MLKQQLEKTKAELTEQLDQARKEGMQFEAEFKIEKEQMEALHIATI